MAAGNELRPGRLRPPPPAEPVQGGEAAREPQRLGRRRQARPFGRPGRPASKRYLQVEAAEESALIWQELLLPDGAKSGSGRDWLVRCCLPLMCLLLACEMRIRPSTEGVCLDSFSRRCLIGRCFRRGSACLEARQCFSFACRERNSFAYLNNKYFSFDWRHRFLLRFGEVFVKIFIYRSGRNVNTKRE